MSFDRAADITLGDASVPEDALRMAALLLVDTLGVAAGAASMDPGRIARDHAERFMGAGHAQDRATLLFDGRQTSIPGAAFAAATQIDNLDAHDGYNPTKGHIGCAVVPALCAFAEARPDLTGRDALVTMTLAYEVATRAAIALHRTVSDYHTSGAWNGLGVVAVAARLRGMGRDQFRHALGIAEYHGPRSQMMREIANPTMLHDGSGLGAFTGAQAALLAEDGFLGAPAITVEDEDVAGDWEDLGTTWTITQNYIKPYPVCRWAHAAIDALDQVVTAHDLTDDAIEAIDVHTFAEAAALFPGMPGTTSEAQYSLGFALATRLVHGWIGPEHITGAGLRDERVAAALQKITIREAARHSARFPLGRWSDVSVRTRNGETFHSGDTHAKGGPEAPMELSEIEQKFKNLTTALEPTRAQALWAMRDRLLHPQTRFSDLLALVHPPVT